MRTQATMTRPILIALALVLTLLSGCTLPGGVERPARAARAPRALDHGRDLSAGQPEQYRREERHRGKVAVGRPGVGWRAGEQVAHLVHGDGPGREQPGGANCGASTCHRGQYGNGHDGVHPTGTPP